MDFPEDFAVAPVYEKDVSTIKLEDAVGIVEHRKRYAATLKLEEVTVEFGDFHSVNKAVDARRAVQQVCIERVMSDWRKCRDKGMEAAEAISVIRENVKAWLRDGGPKEIVS